MSQPERGRRLAGKVAIITGAAAGIGRAAAVLFAAEGARVVATDIGPLEPPGDDWLVLRHDVADEAQWVAVFGAAIERFGRVDILVNNAGISATVPVPLAEVTLADWRRVLSVNLDGTFLGMKLAMQRMAGNGGAIVNIASVLGLRPLAGALHYATAKAGIIALTKSTGQEVAPFGVRVNAVCPGWVDTPLLAPMDPMSMAGIVMQIPRGRMAVADEIAELVRFLAGPEGSYCNGDVFAASGGFV